MVGQGLQEPSSDEKQGNDKENPFVSIDWRASLVPVPTDERLQNILSTQVFKGILGK